MEQMDIQRADHAAYNCCIISLQTAVDQGPILSLISLILLIIKIMSKGFLKIAVLEVESAYFSNKQFTIRVQTDEAVSLTTISPAQHPLTLKTQYNFYPLSDHLEITLFENEETDTRVGYFKIPLSKLYDLPRKNHLINTRCIWLEKAEGTVEKDAQIAGNVKISLIYLDNYTASYTVMVKEAYLTLDTEAMGKMDPFLQCKIGDVCSQTDVKEEAGENPVWNQSLSFIFESIPSKIFFQVKDKDMVNDDVVGNITINPQQLGYLYETKQPVDREFQIKLDGKKSGLIKISTHLKLIEGPSEGKQ